MVEKNNKEKMQIYDKNGNMINPATEETLSSVDSSASGINSHVEDMWYWLEDIKNQTNEFPAVVNADSSLSAGGSYDSVLGYSGNTSYGWHRCYVRVLINTDVAGTFKLWLKDTVNSPIIQPKQVIGNATINSDGTISISGGSSVIVLYEVPAYINQNYYVHYLNGDTAQSYFNLIASMTKH